MERRRRVKSRPTVQSHISQTPSIHASKSAISYKKYLFSIFVIIMIAGVIYFINAPPMKFPREVQHWYDSGYIFKFRNHEIHYQDIPRNWKPVSLTPVLLVIHGFPTSSYDWKDLIPKFHNRFGRIIIPDLLGFGFSDKPTNHTYSLKKQATMIEELINHLNVQDVHILAHDYGDSVVQEMVARSLESNGKLYLNLRSVCLTNGGIIPSQHNARPIQKLLMLPVVKTLFSYLTNRLLFNSRLAAVFAPSSQPSSKYLDGVWSIVTFKKGYTVLPLLLNYIAERRDNEGRWVGALQETTIPLHLIYGPLDPINTPDGFLKSYRKLIPRSTVTVLPNIGHYPQIENEVEFIKSYNLFINKVLQKRKN